MTCIVGIVEDGDVWIGGDSAGVSGLDVTIRTDEKVWKTKHFVYGYTSSFRMGQLLRYKFDPTPWDGKGTIQKYMATTFMDQLRNTFKSGGYMANDNGREDGGDFLVGHQGHLFAVYSDLQFGQSRDDYMSVGCGESYALGALHAMGPNPTPNAKIKKALEAAVHFSGGVRPPFVIKKLKA